jgi:hypothetical protein
VARKAALEHEMQDARAAWDKEKQRSQEELAADKARCKKEWQREQEEYAYTLKTRRIFGITLMWSRRLTQVVTQGRHSCALQRLGEYSSGAVLF